MWCQFMFLIDHIRDLFSAQNSYFSSKYKTRYHYVHINHYLYLCAKLSNHSCTCSRLSLPDVCGTMLQCSYYFGLLSLSWELRMAATDPNETARKTDHWTFSPNLSNLKLKWISSNLPCQCCRRIIRSRTVNLKSGHKLVTQFKELYKVRQWT